jgi:hypothetical protein
MGALSHHQCSHKKRHERFPAPPALHYVKTQGEGGHLQARKRLAPEPDQAGALGLALQPSQCEKRKLCPFNATGGDNLLWQPRDKTGGVGTGEGFLVAPLIRALCQDFRVGHCPLLAVSSEPGMHGKTAHLYEHCVL